jgi:hypothetical protein
LLSVERIREKRIIEYQYFFFSNSQIVQKRWSESLNPAFTPKPELDVTLQLSGHEEGLTLSNLTIVRDGSVINKYPGFRDRCQEFLDQLTLENDFVAPSILR